MTKERKNATTEKCKERENNEKQWRRKKDRGRENKKN
jgi:hypothetical protein